jgi:hypothetical protein
MPEAHCNLGIACYGIGNLEKAEAAYRRASQLMPNSAQILNCLAVTLRERRKLDESVAVSNEAIRIQPAQALGYINLGNARIAQGKLDEAESAYRRALEIEPQQPDAMTNLAHAQYFRGEFDLAAANYRAVLQNSPDFAAAHMGLSMILLTQGKFAEGWRHYDWRWKVRELRIRPRGEAPRWDGSPLNGKTILLYNEQGFGDTIHCLRYLPMVAQRGGKIVLACHTELIPLLKDYPDVERCVPVDQPLSEIDAVCPMLSLPAIFGTPADGINFPSPYLHAPVEESRIWNERLATDHRRRIGIAWAGRPTHPNDHNRSLPPDLLRPFADLPDIRLISLQFGREPAALKLDDWTGEIKNFAQTAALVQNLDLVICVDTAVAHLAGAIGKPVWVLLPLVPDWRWGLGTESTPWYPTMRLFRQQRLGDWAPPLRRVFEELKRA